MKKKTVTLTTTKSRPVMRVRTETRRAQDMLLELFKEAVESSSDAIGMSTPEGVHYYQNRAFNDLFGDIGSNPPASLYVVKKIGHEVFATIMSGKRWFGEVEMYAKDRRVLCILLRAYPIKDSSGRIIGLVGIHTDTTSLKNAEVALLKSEEHYRVLTETATDAIITANGQGRIVSWNSGAERIYGYKPKEIIGQDFALLIPENQREQHKEFFIMMVKNGKMVTSSKPIEGIGHRKDGSEFAVEPSFALCWINDEPFFTIIARDVSERKQLEKKLHESEELFRMNFENAPIGICLFDKYGALLKANLFFERCFGHSREELLRQGSPCFLHPDDQRKTTDIFLILLNNHEMLRQSTIVENRFFSKDGKTIYTKQHIQGAFNNEGTLNFITVLTEDITATKQLTLMNEAIVHKLKNVYSQLNEFNASLPDKEKFLSAKSLGDYGLTHMETRIASMIFQVSTNKKIAHKLCVSENTVKHHITKIYHKMNVKNRIGFINAIRKDGIVL